MTVIIIISIIVLDQLSKYIAVNYFNQNKYVSREKSDIIRITIIKNSGAAFGLLRGKSRLLKIINIFALIILMLYLGIALSQSQDIVLKFGISCIVGGGLGNLIDRVRFNYVIDFITLSFKKCPVFNVADICIFLGTIIIVFTIIFQYSLNM